MFRVDGMYVAGELGIYGYGNSGSLYQLEDIRGISPLFLETAYAIIQGGTPFERVWEVFAVKYVFTDAEELPTDSTLIGRDYPHDKTLNLHRLDDPRPFAHLVYAYEVASDDATARARLNLPEFDPRHVLILDEAPSLSLPNTPPRQCACGDGLLRARTHRNAARYARKCASQSRIGTLPGLARAGRWARCTDVPRLWGVGRLADTRRRP